ncbi:MAG: hypothetical protein LHW46_01105, partial [Candidatus Cloacimonetes bacterium]|nr:hypothetical protein [Candidatus Cloacimonadota bacterium]
QKYELDWRWTVSQCQVLMNPKWVCVVNLRGIVTPECKKISKDQIVLDTFFDIHGMTQNSVACGACLIL